MIAPAHLLDDVIRPALALIGLGSAAAEQLVLGTCVTESTVGNQTFLHQGGSGPALGIAQMEPATHTDLWANVLAYKPQLRSLVEQLIPPLYRPGTAGAAPAHRVLCGHLLYAAAMARLQYWRQPTALPAAGDWLAMAIYWKAHYNTALGAGTHAHFLDQLDAHRVRELWP